MEKCGRNILILLRSGEMWKEYFFTVDESHGPLKHSQSVLYFKIFEVKTKIKCSSVTYFLCHKWKFIVLNERKRNKKKDSA